MRGSVGGNLHFTQAQLAAGGVDVMPFFVAHGDGYTFGDEGFAEEAAGGLGGAHPGETFYRVVGDKVDFGVEQVGNAGEFIDLGQHGVDILNQDVLERDFVFGGAGPLLQGGYELAEGPFFVNGHDLVAHFITRAVQGDGEAERAPECGQFFKPGHVAGGRDGDVAGPDVEGVLIHNDGEGGQEVIHVGKGLSHAHEDEVVYAGAAYLLCRYDLTYNLCRGEVAGKPQQAAGAEFAAEGAAYLRGDAQGDAAAVNPALAHGCGDDDGLHQVAVLHAGEEFAGGADGAFAYLHHLQRAQGALSCQLLTQSRGQVGHGIEGGNAVFPHPLLQLFGAVGLLAEGGHELYQLCGGAANQAGFFHGDYRMQSTYCLTSKGMRSSLPSPTPSRMGEI